MGVIGAGFLHIVTPFFFVFPGLLAFKLIPNLNPPDAAYLSLVQKLVWPGLRGLILAAMAAALMSNLSAVLNSASTLLTIDFYRKLNRDSTEIQQVRFGQIAGAVILAASATIALIFSLRPDIPLFLKVQNIFFFIAPPFSVIFCAGILWRRANTPAALITIVLGFLFSFAFDQFIKGQQGVYLHRAFFTWCFCVITMAIASLLTAPLSRRWMRPSAPVVPLAPGGPEGPVLSYESQHPPPTPAPTTTLNPFAYALSTPPPDQIHSIIWTTRYARLPEEDRRRYHGIKDWRLWWLLFVGIILGIYAFFLWFRFQHPVKMLPF
jgi:SSS family solute:Na+ symporter